MPAGGFWVIDESDFNPTPGEPLAQHFALSGDQGDDVWLTINDAVNGVIFVDDVHFGPTANGVSLGRVPDGSGRLTPTLRPTLGDANATARVGQVLISEVQFAPETPSPESQGLAPSMSAADLEFIEIFNSGLSMQSLEGWRIRGDVQMDFDATSRIAPSRSMVVVSFDSESPANRVRRAAFAEHYQLDELTVLVGGYEGRLDDSAGWIRLERALSPPPDRPAFVAQVFEDEVLYHSNLPWPIDTVGTGRAIQRRQPALYGNDATSWYSNDANPGRIDSVASGDFNQDERVDNADINLMFEQLRSSDPDLEFDLNGDANVDAADRDILVLGLARITYGDANFDRQFDSRDLVAVFATGEYEDSIAGNSSWEEGDWNGDGDFGTEDLVLAFIVGGYRLAAMPRRIPASLLGAALDFADVRDLDDIAEQRRPVAALDQPVQDPWLLEGLD